MASRSLSFLLHEWLTVDTLCRRPRFSGHSRESIDERLFRGASLAEEKLAPINRLLDEEEASLVGDVVQTPPALAEAVAALADLGVLSASHDRLLGGEQLPLVIEKALSVLMNAASVTVNTYVFVTQAVSRLIRHHADARLLDTCLPQMLRGQALGTLCLSEPQAGSSLADIRMRAVPQPDGSYRLYGHKMWISCGDHEVSDNIIHVVAAKIEGADGSIQSGARALSLFVVPKHLHHPDGSGEDRNDVVADSLTPKMGQKGAPSCMLSFGEGFRHPQGEAGAVGFLLGKPEQGLGMINEITHELRIDIGLAAASLGYAGYLHSLDYARERLQGRVPGMGSSGTTQIPIIGHADVRRLLLSQKAYAEGGLALGLWCARWLDECQTAETDAARLLAEDMLVVMAPVLKSWAAQWCLKANAMAIEVLGSYGYMRDYPLEQFYRDNRLNAIQEGTHGIQSLELLRFQLARDDQRLFRQIAQRVCDTADRAAARGGDGRYMAILLKRYTERIATVLGKLYAEPDLTRRLANASVFMEVFGQYLVAWIWLEQWLVAEVANLSAYGAERHFYAGKCQTALFYFRSELPRIDPQLLVLEQMDMTAADMRPEWF